MAVRFGNGKEWVTSVMWANFQVQITKRFLLQLLAFRQKFLYLRGRCLEAFQTHMTILIKIEELLKTMTFYQTLEDTFDNDLFPGYENVNSSWRDLSRVIEKDTWKTALKNQKGVYLITDISNGKMYVGKASGEEMKLRSWQSYIKSGDGGNIELEKLSFDHIKTNFKFSILDIYKSTIGDKIISDRETWWKENLQTRKFGYNKN